MADVWEARVKQKKDTLANWEANPMIILDGEQAFVVGSTGQPINFKIGDGTKRFSELPFWIQYDQAAFIPASGLALPTPTQPVGYSILGEGAYTHASGGFTVPAGHWGIANWDGSAWSFSDMGALPTESKAQVIEEGNLLAPTSDATWKADKQIKDKIDEFTQSKNLFNKDGVVAGELLDIPVGTPAGKIKITPHAPSKRSGYIKLEEGDYTLSGLTLGAGGLYGGLFGDTVTDGEWGDRVRSNNFSVVGTKYFSFTVSYNNAAVNLDIIQLEKGTVATEYAPFGTTVKPSAIKMASTIEDNNKLPVSSELVFNATKPINDILVVGNYFNKEDIVTGELLDVPVGTPTGKIKITASASWNRTGYIGPLYKGKYKILGISIGSNAMFAGLFNDTLTDAEWGDRVTSNTFEITTDEPKYLTFSVKSASFQADLDAIQVKTLGAPDEYMEYGDVYIDGSKVLSNSDDKKDYSTELYVTSNSVYIRNQYNETHDVVVEYQYNNITTTNGCFSPKRTFKIPKSTGITQNLTSYLVHNTDDSISALGTDPYWFILGQHGYLIPRVTSTGNTFVIGEQVVDALSRRFEVIHKDGDFIYLSPRITVSGDTITRDWTFGSAQITSLSTLDSSKTHSVSATSNYQIKPMMHKKSQKILLDGNEITNTGVFRGNEVELIDVFSCINPIGAVFNGITSVNGTELTEVSQSYYFKGRSVYLSCLLNQKDKLPFIKYHVVQPLGLLAVNNYVPYAMYPKVKPQPSNGSLLAVDWNYPQANSGNTNVYSKYLFAVNSNDLIDVNDIPDRTIQFQKNTSGQYQIGFASGLDLETGLTAKSLRPLYVNEAFQLAKSADTPNKTYFRGLTKSAFTNGVLPSTFVGLFNSYYAYFEPKDNVQAYQVNSKDCSYVYIHTQAKIDKELIDVDFIDGLRLTVVEASGITLLTDRVIDGKIYVKSDSANASYIVVRTN